MSTMTAPAVPAPTAPEPACMVKVRFAGERRFWFIGDGGRATSRRVRACLVWDRAKAVELAQEVLAEGPETGVAAVAVMQSGRRVFHAGEPTPGRARYGPEGGYRYLVDVKRGRAVMHVRDDDGQWAPFDEAAYEACVQEASRAGADSARFTVHARSCLLHTSGTRFVQHTTS